MPVFSGSVPPEMLKSMKGTIYDEDKPRIMLKNLYDSGKITQINNLQLVSEVLDLYPLEDAPEVSFNDRPSMLHHVNKTDLESYVIQNPHIV